MRQFLNTARMNGQTVGLVPTMGALHKGHSSLLERSMEENNLTVCSIFVNPEQFNDPKDLEQYPRDFDKDEEVINNLGPAVIFYPSNDEMYLEKPFVSFDFGSLDKTMEGEFRQDHFSGVGIVVCKLFNIIRPTKAYFGQKDFQQVSIIKKIVNDLSYETEIVEVPTVREEDGLAFSSRNQNLTHDQREIAPILFQGLNLAKSELLNGLEIEQVKQHISQLFHKKWLTLEYFEVVNANNLNSVNDISSAKEIVLCVAAKIGNVRLIDNLPLFD